MFIECMLLLGVRPHRGRIISCVNICYKDVMPLASFIYYYRDLLIPKGLYVYRNWLFIVCSTPQGSHVYSIVLGYKYTTP
jgi:hypothetical protein